VFLFTTAVIVRIYTIKLVEHKLINIIHRNIWILEEKELLQEVSGMGELSEPWHSKQVELLDRHLQLLHLYSQAKQNLENQKGKLIELFYFIRNTAVN
jgi:hypothetical protein